MSGFAPGPVGRVEWWTVVDTDGMITGMGIRVQLARVDGARLAKLVQADEPVAGLWPDDAEPGGLRCDLDKAWGGIEFLLAAVGSPVDPIFGGQPFGDNLGGGPARFLTADEVVRAAAFLAEWPFARLAEKYDARKMSQAGTCPLDSWGDDADVAKVALSRKMFMRAVQVNLAKLERGEEVPEGWRDIKERLAETSLEDLARERVPDIDTAPGSLVQRNLKWLGSYYEPMRELYRQAGQAGEAVVLLLI